MNTFIKYTLWLTLICIFNYYFVESAVLGEKSSTRALAPSFSDRCYISRFACHCIRKPRDLKCASNGETFRNKCAIHCYNKHCPRNITIVHGGSCESSTKPNKCDSDPCICTFIFLPVCGNNNVTYSNDCLLRCAQRCDSTLQLSKSGPCQPN